MDTDLTVIGGIAGVVASLTQFSLTKFGFLKGYQTLVALGLSGAAGAIVTVGFGDIEVKDFAQAAGASLVMGQSIYAIVLTRIPSK